MVHKLAIPAIAVLGAAWVLVQPDTPPPVVPAATGDATAEATPAPSSAIELLGETWTRDVPGPVIRPLTAEEHAAAIAAIRQAETRVAPRVDAPSQAASFRRPVPRPEPGVPYMAAVEHAAATPDARPYDPGTVVIVTGDAYPHSDPPRVIRLRDAAPSTAAIADDGMRWVVRRQGSGDVVAEVSLAEALAILTSR